MSVLTSTPGPWRYERGYSGADWSIAETPNFTICSECLHSDELGTEEADARLLAAAPAILAALVDLVEINEETDAYPTLDSHPLYAARRVLEELGVRERGEGGA